MRSFYIFCLFFLLYFNLSTSTYAVALVDTYSQIEVQSFKASKSNQQVTLSWTAHKKTNDNSALTKSSSSLNSASVNNISSNLLRPPLPSTNTYTIEQKKDNGSWVTLTSNLKHSKVETLYGHYGSTVLYSGIYLVSDLTGGGTTLFE